MRDYNNTDLTKLKPSQYPTEFNRNVEITKTYIYGFNTMEELATKYKISKQRINEIIKIYTNLILK